MGQGYTRNDTSNNIADGNVVDAADLDGEFDAIVAAFDASTGHTHDGTSAEGAPITVVGPAQEYVGSGTAFYPKTDDNYDLGTATYQWKDAYIDGTAYIDAGNVDALTVNTSATFAGATIADLGTVTTANIDGGTVDGVIIGGGTAAAATVTDLTASGTVDLSGATVSDLGTVTTADINGGTIDGVTIGGASAGAGTFSTLTSSGTVNLTGATVSNGGTVTTVDINGGTIDATTIGATTKAAGSFSNLTATGTFTLGATAVTSTGTELNVLDGITPSTTELNYVNGVTSAIQTQLDAKIASDAGLTSIAGLTTAADKMIYTTASDTYAVTDLSSFARTLLDDAAASNARTTLGVAIGSDVQAYDAETLKADTDDNVTAGYTATADDDGTKSSGTYTPDPAGGNLKYISNGGAFTLATPTASGDYTLIIQVTNTGSAGAITMSGFSKEAGDSLTTTSGDDFFLFITKLNGFSSITVQALQ